jgi:hypothetical protein
MSPNDEGVPNFMAAASAHASISPFKNPFPVFCSPMRDHDHSALRGNDGADARYLLAFIDLAPYFREGMSGKAFIHKFLGPSVSAYTEASVDEGASERTLAPPLSVEASQLVREQLGAEQKKSGSSKKGKEKEKQVRLEDAFVSHLYVHPYGHGFSMRARSRNILICSPTSVYSRQRDAPTELEQVL